MVVSVVSDRESETVDLPNEESYQTCPSDADEERVSYPNVSFDRHIRHSKKYVPAEGRESYRSSDIISRNCKERSSLAIDRGVRPSVRPRTHASVEFGPREREATGANAYCY